MFRFISICFVSICFVSICLFSFRSVSFRFVSFRFDLIRFVPFLFCFILHFIGTCQRKSDFFDFEEKKVNRLIELEFILDLRVFNCVFLGFGYKIN